MTAPEVRLVSMPFGHLFYPSLALSTLKPQLEARGIACDVRYFMLDYAARIGFRTYERIADDRQPLLTDLAGEWIFAGALFAETAGDEDGYVDEVLRRRATGSAGARVVPARRRRRLVELRRDAHTFLEACADELLAGSPRLVGFTSMFQQHTASLALARRLKERCPEVVVVLGGPNCDGPAAPATVRSFPFVDAVVCGEADEILGDLVERVLAGRPMTSLPGVLTRANLDVPGATPRTPTVADLDRLPIPDYDDYFTQIRGTAMDRAHFPSLPVETARGCWWGERQHCTFCGLNGSTMRFRSKSPGRALVEIERVRKRWPDSTVQVVDNILDMSYFNELMPALARSRGRSGIFWETKSNLKKEQVRALARAGVREIQPGIESLSDEVLKRMRKGVTGLQNLQLLKWCAEFGVTPMWNFLWGFPGEPPAEYARMAALVPLLVHLPPPAFACSIRLDRFSPNYERAEEMGFADVEPFPAYRHVYAGLPPETVRDLAYFFTYRYREPQDVAAYTRSLGRAIAAWKCHHQRSALIAADDGQRLWVFDQRPAAHSPVHVLVGLARRVHLACDEARTTEAIARELGRADGDVGRIDHEISALAAAGLVIGSAAGGTGRENSRRWLALATALGDGATAPGQPALDALLSASRKLRSTSPAAPELHVGADGALAVGFGL